MKWDPSEGWKKFGYCVFHGRYYHGEGADICPVCDTLKAREGDRERVRQQKIALQGIGKE